MISKNCPITDEHVGIIFNTIGYHNNNKEPSKSLSWKVLETIMSHLKFLQIKIPFLDNLGKF